MNIIRKPTHKMLSEPGLLLHPSIIQPMLDAQQNGGLIYCAIINEKAVGYCVLVKNEEGNFLNIFVNPAHKKNGIGYSLSQEVIQQAFLDPSNKCIKISIAINGPSHVLAAKLGFKETSRNSKEVYLELLRPES